MMWKKYGAKFGVELGKDSLTTNGINIPGVQTVMSKTKLVSATTAQKWGALCVGDFVGGAIGVFDTALTMNKFINCDGRLEGSEVFRVAKAAVKIGVGASHGNVFLVGAGTVDVGVIAMSVINKSIKFEFDSFSPIGIL